MKLGASSSRYPDTERPTAAAARQALLRLTGADLGSSLIALE